MTTMPKSFFALMAKSADEDALLWEVAFAVNELAGVDVCEIYTVDGESLLLRTSTATTSQNNRLRVQKGAGLVGKTFESRKPTYLVKEFSAALPLIEEGQLVGAMFVKAGAKLTRAQQNKLEDLADTVATVLTTYHAIYKNIAQTNRIGALSEVSRVISKSPYLEEILQLLVNFTAQQFGYTVCTVRLLDESRGELVLRATQAPAKAYQRKRAIKFGESIAGKAVAEKRPLVVLDVQDEPDYIGHDLAEEIGLRSMACVPLIMGNRPIGVMSCYTSEVRPFPNDEIKALETLAKQAAASIEHAKMQVRHTLMQEMHHRVKNNLQQIASLLRLQMRHGKYKSLEEALGDCIARILSIASVHDLLSREDLDHVSIKSIGNSLVHHHTSSLISPDRSIKFEVRGDDVYLNMNHATQLALMLNELISNAIEHGFEQTKAGEIHINVEEKPETGEVALWVSNNGDKLPTDFNIDSTSSLGLNIVSSLSRSMAGTFKMENKLGWTVAEVKFFRQGGE